MWIVIHGNPLEGFEHHGLWDTEEAAYAWATAEYEASDDYWVIDLILSNPEFNAPTDDEFAGGKIVDIDPQEIERIIAQAKEAKLPKQIMVDLSELPIGV